MRYRLASKYFILVNLLVLFSVGSLFAQVPQRPQPQRLVNDIANIFTPRELEILENKVVAFDDTTSNQIAIVTVPELYGYDKAYLAYEIGEQWGVGQQEFNNGIVILIKPKIGNSSGEVFIATGYGLEGVVTDAFARRVIEREMIPYFRQNDYFGGVNAALKVLMPVISGEISVNNSSDSDDDGILPSIIFLIVFGLIVFLIITASSGNNQNMGGGNNRGGRNFTIADAIILSSILNGSGHNRGNYGGGYGNGGFGGGFGSGGFGGFGGGSFGGGGAGGSW